MGNNGTAVFFISVATFHSILSLYFNILSGERLRQLQDNLRLVKVIIIYEISMLGEKPLYFIDQIIKQVSGKMDEVFGGLSIIFVGDFQKLPPMTCSSLIRPLFLHALSSE